MAVHDVDLVVLGGGSGGYAAALRGAELGMSVTLIEKDKVGGTCLHRGCIPTKAVLHSAEVADHVRDAAKSGVSASLDGIDPAGVRTYQQSIVAKKFAGLQGLIKARGITTIHGEGRLTPDRGVVVGDEIYRGQNVILATGSYTRTLPGLELGGRILGSTEALLLDVIPESVLVLGGGVIGVEFASIWRSFGADVTIVEALPGLIPNEDATLRKGLERAYRRRGITYSVGVRLASATQDDSGVTVSLEDGKEFRAEYLLVAVGRSPATAGLGFEDAGVSLDRGFVVVDDQLRTTAENVWAVGDITPGLQLAHRGFQQGIAVAERIAGIAVPALNEAQIPRVTYSSPEVASVGLTEEQAIITYGAESVQSHEYNLAGNGKSEILGTAGLVKAIRVKDGPVIGLHLIGDRVGELITEGQLAVAWEAFPEDIAPLIHAHPTQSEALGEAFLALAGKPLHAI